MKLTQKIALNSSVQAARQVFLAIAGIVSVGVATRYLSVDQYGAILAALILLSLVSVATDFGISAMTARAMAREPENEIAIQSSAFWVWVAFTVPTALAILLISQIAYPGPGNATTRDAVLILMVTFPLTPFAGVANVRAVSDQRVWVMSVASIIARGLALIAIILAAALDLGPMGITAAFASGFVLEQAFGILFMRPKIEFSVGLHRARIWSLVAAAVPLGAVMVINGLYFRLDAFLISVLGSDRDLAVYGVAYKAFESLLVFPEFVMITLIPVLARLHFSEARFQELVQKAFTAMNILVLPVIGFSLLGRPAMVALAGPKYAGGGLVLGLIMCSVAIACIQGVFGNALVTQGRQGALLRVSVSVLIANALVNFAAIPRFGDRGAAGALLLTEALSLALTLGVYHRFAPLPRVHMPVRMLLALAALVAVAVACVAVSGSTVGMAVAVVAGLIAYASALVLLRALPAYVSEPIAGMLRSLRPGGRTA
ncbi:MAG: oligosaccharide flippase family protein [Solirubrobacterales bacterium]|nr:oligosaccharide flippase family protein [Solirubrobacterales bacterium]